jgi:hypothetical protein
MDVFVLDAEILHHENSLRQEMGVFCSLHQPHITPPFPFRNRLYVSLLRATDSDSA